MLIICHIGELALKGKNRGSFERVLLLNIKEKLETDFPNIECKIINNFGRIIIEILSEKICMKKLRISMSEVFGLSNFSFAEKTENDIEKIKEACINLVSKAKFDTFRCSARRSEKSFPLNSETINRKIGEYVVKKLAKKVNLTKFDVEIVIEITTKGAFVYCEKIRGAGGMPVGTAGKAIVLLSGGLDSPVAAYYSLKRGLKTKFVHFHSVPYTSKESIEKVKKLAKILSKYGSSCELHLIPFADTQKEIMMNVPDKFRVLFYRRIMLQIAERIAKRNKCKALITGDSLAQVASQTVENLQAVGAATQMLLLRPLIGFDKEEIMDLAKKIGTYEISIEPHDDCCSRLMPKNPEIYAKIEDILKAEENLDIEKIIKECILKSEKISL